MRIARAMLATACSVFTTLLLPSPTLAAPPKYFVTDLGSLGGDNAEAAFINDLGQIVGASDLPGNSVNHAFRINAPPITPASDLGIPPSMGSTGAYTGASVINNAGQIAAV